MQAFRGIFRLLLSVAQCVLKRQGFAILQCEILLKNELYNVDHCLTGALTKKAEKTVWGEHVLFFIKFE